MQVMYAKTACHTSPADYR